MTEIPVPTDRQLESLVHRVLDETWEAQPPDDGAQSVYHLPKTLSSDQLPKVFRRVKSAHGFLSAWKKMRNAVWVAGGVPYKKLPEFAYRWGRRMYETHERQAYDALIDGDVAFFDAWTHRFAIIDAAAQEAKLSIRERGTILYVTGVLSGYAEAASMQLKTLGGPKLSKRR